MATHLTVVGGHPEGFGATTRNDNWWVGPLLTFLGLSAFVVYTTWAAFQGAHYMYGPYLSPFYSPLLFVDPDAAAWAVPAAQNADALSLSTGYFLMEHSWFGAWPSWWPDFLPASPALLILVFPASFRFTCYYYRKAYYRSFAGSPPGCAVGPMASQRTYRGESALMIFQNLHRYALYFAILYIPILYWDAFYGFYAGGEWGIGVGSIVLTINATLLACYTFGCHSFRHLIGGRSDCMSCGKKTATYEAWSLATWFNERHMVFAWCSLIWVALTDLYVRLVSMGVITDYNTWN